MEAKYIYNFRKFYSYTFEQLKILARYRHVTYTHPYLSKRKLAKKLAIECYEAGIDFKSEFMEVD
jgi:hypothetical protein